MTLNNTPSLYVFAFSSVDEPIADAIRKDAAAKAGASDYRRRLCLGFEPLTTSALKGKARSYASSYVSKIREAEKLLAAAAAERGYNLIEVTAADRCKHWAIVPRDFDFAAAMELLAAEKAELAAAKKAEAAAAKAAAKAAPTRATGPATGFPPFAR